MQLLTPDFGLLFWQFVVFLALFFVLRAKAWRPILKSLKEREDTITDSLALAEKTRAEMKLLGDNNQKMLAEAKAQRDIVLKDARTTAEKMIQEAKNEAAKAAQEEIQKARVIFDNEKSAAVSQLRKEAALLTVQIAEQLLRKELSDKKSQEELITNLLKNSTLN